MNVRSIPQWLVGCMVVAVVLHIGLVSGAEPEVPARTSPSTQAKVHEALQREVYGLAAERDKMLSAAVMSEAGAAFPRWYLGQVRAADGTWRAIDKPPAAREGQLYRSYVAQRSAKADDAVGQKLLADWCSRNGLLQQERAHLWRSLSLNPNQMELRQRLDLVRVGERWAERTAVSREQQRLQAARDSYEHWLPIITKLAPQVASPDESKRRLAAAQLLAISDVGALPALQTILGNRGDEGQMLVLQVSSQLAEVSSTELIAWVSVSSPSPRVRQTAIQLLKPRELVDYAPLLIAEMYSPVVTKVETARLPNGSVGLRRSFVREGADQFQVFVSEARFDPRGITGWMREGGGTAVDLIADYDRAERGAAQATVSSELAVAEQNGWTEARNQRLAETLTAVTGEKLPPQPEAWWKWWMDLNELTLPAGKGLATRYQWNQVDVLPLKSPSSIGIRDIFDERLVLGVSCLNAGTPIWTDQGPVAVECVKIGDLVLSRDIETGELAYKPVLLTTVREKRLLTELAIGDDKIQATGGHLFWVSGTGWVRAKELRPSQVLHTATAPANILAVQPGIMAKTYNLVVADFHTYFVGEHKLLSHDNTPRRPTRMIVPGLAAQ